MTDIDCYAVSTNPHYFFGSDTLRSELNEANAVPLDGIAAERADLQEVFVLATEIKELYESNSAATFISKVRWKDGFSCPRCNSQLIKKINSAVLVELLKCVNCSYTFNFRSGTVIQGCKLAPELILQFILLRDLLGQSCTARNLAHRIDVTDQTARSLLKRFDGIKVEEGYFRKAPDDKDIPYPSIDAGDGIYTEFTFYILSRRVEICVKQFERRVFEALAPT